MTTDHTLRNHSFRVLLAALNPAQRRAVETTEGPVLVIAGPGTGKTHVLAARIGKILLDTDTRPQNILCLTFTDAGAVAMRRRLLEMIGPEAHRVPIYTFHGFCNRVIQENLELFGPAPRLEPISDLERIEIVRALLTDLPPEHPLREGRKDPFQFERHLRDLFATMKKEGWTPGVVLKKVKEYVEALPQNPDFQYKTNSKHGKKGEPKTALLAEARDRMQRLSAAADLYPKYLRAMERAGRYEYEDMLLWVSQAFSRNEALLRGYQERFQYFLVDEYQDTNGAQNRLLQLLIDYWESPNIFIVGDDDQSIYEFQGARLKNLLDFHQAYRQELTTVVLEDNYRSTQPILDAAAQVIQHNELRAVRTLEVPITKDLRAHIPDPVGQAIKGGIRVYENRLHEVADLVHRIETLLQAGTEATEIAVLYAKHRQAAPLLTLLEKKGIPYQTKRPVNILDLPLIQHLRDLLHYLQEERMQPFSGERRLFRLLHAAFFGVNPLDLAKVAVALKPAIDGVALSHPVQEAGSWRAALSNPSFLQSLSLADPEKLLALAAQFEAWLTAAHNLGLPALIENLYNRSGLLTYALAQPDRIWHLQVLNTFLDFIKAEADRNPRFSLERLLSLLKSMDDNHLPLQVQQTVRTGDGIQLLTAHSAKGLEFRHVFLLGCTADFWEPTPRAQSGRFALPNTLTLSGEEDALEARRRLFYVALTRARTDLTISYARLGPDGKALTQARFVDETELPKTDAVPAQDTLLEAQTYLLLEPAKPLVTLPEAALLDGLLENFTLTITSLNRYLRCPLAFYYEDLLQIPEVVSEAAAYGEAVHGALQQFFLRMKNDPDKLFPSADGLTRLFQAEMERRRVHFAEQTYRQRLALGKNYLQRYHAEQVPHWTRRAIVERRIDRVELNGIPLAGALDKLEWRDDATLCIVDYKTGNPDPKKAAPPELDKQPLGGDFWRQLAFYKVLLDQARLYPEPVRTGVVAWLEPDRKGQFPTQEIAFSGAETRWMEELIKDVYGKIQARQFTEGCGREDCAWCRMHRLKELPAAGFERVEEGLDDGV